MITTTSNNGTNEDILSEASDQVNTLAKLRRCAGGAKKGQKFVSLWLPLIQTIFLSDPGKPGVRSLGPDQSVTFVKMLLRMNVRIYSYQQNYTNEYPNIFILIYLTRTNVRISIENCMNIQIYSNIRLGFTL